MAEVSIPTSSHGVDGSGLVTAGDPLRSRALPRKRSQLEDGGEPPPEVTSIAQVPPLSALMCRELSKQCPRETERIPMADLARSWARPQSIGNRGGSRRRPAVNCVAIVIRRATTSRIMLRCRPRSDVDSRKQLNHRASLSWTCSCGTNCMFYLVLSTSFAVCRSRLCHH